MDQSAISALNMSNLKDPSPILRGLEKTGPFGVRTLSALLRAEAPGLYI